jgi:hypothetical protein
VEPGRPDERRQYVARLGICGPCHLSHPCLLSV